MINTINHVVNYGNSELHRDDENVSSDSANHYRQSGHQICRQSQFTEPIYTWMSVSIWNVAREARKRDRREKGRQTVTVALLNIYVCLFVCLFSSSSNVVISLLSKLNPPEYKHAQATHSISPLRVWSWDSSLDAAQTVHHLGNSSPTPALQPAPGNSIKRRGKEFWFYRGDVRLPRRPYLHITMKRIKLTHKRGCRGNKTGTSRRRFILAGFTRRAGKFWRRARRGRWTTSRLSKVSTQ